MGVVALLCLVGAAPAAAAADLVTFVDTTASIPPQSDATASFPVTPAEGVKLESVTPRVLQLSRENVQIPTPPGLTAALNADLGALVLAVPADQLPAQGTYSVVIGLQRGQDRQLVTLTLTRPSGAVSAPGTVRVELTTLVPCLGWKEKEHCLGRKESKPRLTLVGSPDTRILTLNSRQLEAEDPQVTVTVPSSSPVMEPSKPVDFRYTVDKASTPGTLTRSVQFSSPQLSQPVQVTFTIVTRRTPILIGVALLVGLLLGVVLRLALPKLTTWLDSQRQRNALLEELERLKETYADPVFWTTIDPIIANLRAAKGKQVSAQVTSSRVVADAALKELNDRLSQQGARFRAAAAVYKTTWRVPSDKPDGQPQPGIEDGLRRAREQLDAADIALTSKNAGDAATAMGQVDAVTADLIRATAAWGAQVQQSLGGLRDQLQGFDRGALGNLRVAIGTALACIPTPAPAGGQADSLQEAEKSLRGVHDTTSAYASAGPYLDDLADEATRVGEILEAHSQQVGDLPDAADALRSVNQDDDDDPARTGADVGTAVSNLISAAKSAMNAAGAKNNPAVSALLDRGALVDAAQELARSTRTRLGAGSSTAAMLPSTAMPLVMRYPDVVLAQPHAPIASELRTGPGPARLAFVGGFAWFLHLLVAVVIVGFTGYMLFLPGWTGSFADLTKVVIWAFAVDVSLAGLTLLMASPTTSSK